jgi:hypothetical protein
MKYGELKMERLKKAPVLLCSRLVCFFPSTISDAVSSRANNLSNPYRLER